MNATNNTIAKPASEKQIYRITKLKEAGIYAGDIPSTSWEASVILRNAPASKKDKDDLKAKGGRVLTRMTSGELEMTNAVVEALKLIDASGVKNAKVVEASMALRKLFLALKPQ